MDKSSLSFALKAASEMLPVPTMAQMFDLKRDFYAVKSEGSWTCQKNSIQDVEVLLWI